MVIVDSHCDTLSKIFDENSELYENSHHVDIKRIMKIDREFVQFMAIFIKQDYLPGNTLKRALQLIDNAFLQFERYKADIELCLCYDDIKKILKKGKIAAILTIEGGEVLQGEITVLRILYRLGVRGLCLTWNNRNELADGVCEEGSKGGLTAFGRDVVHEMNRLGMIVDVSHIYEHGFWDCIEQSKDTVMASHSNAKALCSHRRNLTNEQILAISKKNGVIGVNFYPAFLSDSGQASIKDIVAHIEHICSIGGINCVGLGGDLDGIENLPTGFIGVEDYPLIIDELLKLNYSYEQVEKIAGGNLLKVIETVMDNEQ